MIIIVAAVVGFLLITVIAMIVRVIMNKRKMEQIPANVMDGVQTCGVLVEPQFVLAADDSKNIFAHTSNVAFGADIEGAENKKPGSGDNKRRTKKKKTVLRKVKESTEREEKKDDSIDDDGFNNYEGDLGASGTKFFDRPSSASENSNRGLKSGSTDNNTRKIVALRQVDED